MMIKRAFFVLAAGAALAALPVTLAIEPASFAPIFNDLPAYAQAVVTPTAPDTRIEIGAIVAPWLQTIAAAFAAVVMALFGWITALITRKTGIEIDSHFRDTIQTALTNAAGHVIVSLGERLNTIELDVHNPLIKQAILSVNAGAHDALAHFGMTDDVIARKILEKIGVVTAPSSALNPTAVVPPAHPVA